MADRPIMYSAPMVQALIAGRKTQTRRLATSPLARARPGDRLWVRENVGRRVASFLGIEATNGVENAFYLADGDEVVNDRGFNLCPWWASKGGLPSIHMPRWASRLTQIVESVKFESLHAISEEDAIAEGIEHPFTQEVCDRTAGLIGSRAEDHGWVNYLWHGRPDIRPSQADAWPHQFSTYRDPRGSYSSLWERLHGRGSWDENPDLVVITARLEHRNIDAPPAPEIAA